MPCPSLSCDSLTTIFSCTYFPHGVYPPLSSVVSCCPSPPPSPPPSHLSPSRALATTLIWTGGDSTKMPFALIGAWLRMRSGSTYVVSSACLIYFPFFLYFSAWVSDFPSRCRRRLLFFLRLISLDDAVSASRLLRSKTETGNKAVLSHSPSRLGLVRCYLPSFLTNPSYPFLTLTG